LAFDSPSAHHRGRPPTAGCKQLSCRTPLLRFGPLQRIWRAGSTMSRGFPPSRRPLPGFEDPLATDLFSQRAATPEGVADALGVHPTGLFPHGEPWPLPRLGTLMPFHSPGAADSPLRSRLAADFRVLLPPGVRTSTTGGLDLPLRPMPSWAYSSLGHSLSPPWGTLPHPSPHALRRPRPRPKAELRFRVSRNGEIGFSLGR